jgi:hypothetical protein
VAMLVAMLSPKNVRFKLKDPDLVVKTMDISLMFRNK